MSECLNLRKITNEKARERLNWMLIYLVAESEFSGNQIFVSDLYVEMDEAKTTVNSHINNLIACEVLEKSDFPLDGRRQILNLTNVFKDKFRAHILTIIQSKNSI
jgi:DNA-binding MarR family transcriptional regulator